MAPDLASTLCYSCEPGYFANFTRTAPPSGASALRLQVQRRRDAELCERHDARPGLRQLARDRAAECVLRRLPQRALQHRQLVRVQHRLCAVVRAGRCLGGTHVAARDSGRSRSQAGGLCTEGYVGVGCDVCSNGFYTVSDAVHLRCPHADRARYPQDRGTCAKCPAFPTELFLGLILVAAIVGVLYWRGIDLPGCTAGRAALPDRSPRPPSLIRLKIATNFIQLIILSAAIVVLWPDAVNWVKGLANTVGAALFAAGPSPRGAHCAQTLLSFSSIHSECFSKWNWHEKIAASVRLARPQPSALRGKGGASLALTCRSGSPWWW
jgi:hypothetical protein